MPELLDAVVDFVSRVSPARVRAVAAALAELTHDQALLRAHSLVETPAAQSALRSLLDTWAETKRNGGEVAGMLLGAAHARERVERDQKVELVWTGPTTRFVPTRRTEQVLLDLLATAVEQFFLVSFVAYDVPSVVSGLNEAARRGVRLRILLEASTSQGGTLSYDPAAIMRMRVPSAELFKWTDRAEPFVGGKVHAKVALVDGACAFITSANVTEHALGKNMEAGVLVRGGELPRMLADHFEALIAVGTIGRASS